MAPALPAEARATRIPSLDGFRAIAIGIVMATHQVETGVNIYTSALWPYLNMAGELGVRIFFVLAGFLITSQLLSELERTQSISLRRFYFRRSLRIFPAFYVFLAAVAVLYALRIFNVEPPSSKSFRIAALYLTDYNMPKMNWTLGHTWTLSVEEQFYLLWPAVLLLLRPRNAAWLLVLAIFATPFTRFYWGYFNPSSLGYKFHFEAAMDSLAMGCLVAIYWTKVAEWIKRYSLPSILTHGVLLIATVGLYIWSARSFFAASSLGIGLLNLTVAIAIAAAVLYPPAWLNIAPLRIMGKLSYSLYLWQQVLVEHVRLGIWWIPLTFVFAAASYTLVERPILRWRDRHRGRIRTAEIARHGESQCAEATTS